MPSAPTDYTAPMWAALRARKLADGWPMPGPQGDGTFVEWTSSANEYEPTRYVAHKNYLRYLMGRKGKAKQTLLCKIYLEQGNDEYDTDAVSRFVNTHIGKSNPRIREIFAKEILKIEG